MSKIITLDDIKILGVSLNPEVDEEGVETGDYECTVSYERLDDAGDVHDKQFKKLSLTTGQQTTINNFIAAKLVDAKSEEGI